MYEFVLGTLSEMATNEVIPANSVLFEELCEMLEQLYKIKKNQKNNRNKIGVRYEQFKILESFVNNFKCKVAAVQGKKVSFFSKSLVWLMLRPNRRTIG